MLMIRCMSNLQACSGSLGGRIISEGMCQVVQLGAGVAVDWCSIVGVCENDLLAQAAQLCVLEPRHLIPACSNECTC